MKCMFFTPDHRILLSFSRSEVILGPLIMTYYSLEVCLLTKENIFLSRYQAYFRIIIYYTSVGSAAICLCIAAYIVYNIGPRARTRIDVITLGRLNI